MHRFNQEQIPRGCHGPPPTFRPSHCDWELDFEAALLPDELDRVKRHRPLLTDETEIFRNELRLELPTRRLTINLDTHELAGTFISSRALTPRPAEPDGGVVGAMLAGVTEKVARVKARLTPTPAPPPAPPVPTFVVTGRDDRLAIPVAPVAPVEPPNSCEPPLGR